MTIPTEVSLALSASWIIPIIPSRRVLTDCSLVINHDKIVDILPTNELTNRYQPQHTLSLEGHVLLPGLINNHGHAAMVLLRGFADDLPLDIWLQQHIWPAEKRWVNEDFVKAGTELAIAEMLLSGTTSFSDMYYYPEVTAAVAHESGIRAQLCFPILDFPSAWASNADEYIHKGIKLHDHFRSHKLISTGFGPHAPYTVSDAPLKRIAMLAEELQCPIQIHLHESTKEIADSLAQYGRRPLQRLAELGLISPLTQCVHMTQINDEDVATVAQYGAHIVHCPQSNLKLASGLCPTQRLIDAGVNLSLGTDGAASNNSLDMFAEIKTAALLGKLSAAKADAVNAWQVLEMATINGAKAMGQETLIGSLETGKMADVIAVDLSDINLQPLYDIASQLVYCQNGHRVNHLWVDGVQLVNKRELTRMNRQDILKNTQQWQKKIADQL